MKDTTIATVRTTLPLAWVSFISAVAFKLFHWTITMDDLLPFMPVFAVGYGILYRALREVERRFPSIGFVIFGINTTPKYKKD